jgi:protein TonB
VLVGGYFLFFRSSSASAAEGAQTVLVTVADTHFTSRPQLDPVGALRLSDGAAEPTPIVAPSTPPEPSPQAPSKDQLVEYLRALDRPDTGSLYDEGPPSRAESQELASKTVQESEPLGPDSADLITESPEAQEPMVPVPGSLAAAIDTSPAETESEPVAASLPTVDPERYVPLDSSQTPPEPVERDGIARDLNDLDSTESESTAASAGLELPSTQAGTKDSEAPSTRVPQDAAVLVQPRLETPPRPHYPAAARRLRRAATVSVRVLIDPTGKVREAEIDGPRTGLGFDGAAVSAAKRSRWEPATRNGEPVEAWAVLTIEFQP